MEGARVSKRANGAHTSPKAHSSQRQMFEIASVHLFDFAPDLLETQQERASEQQADHYTKYKYNYERSNRKKYLYTYIVSQQPNEHFETDANQFWRGFYLFFFCSRGAFFALFLLSCIN